MKLLDAQATDGDGRIVNLSPHSNSNRNSGMLYITGVWDGATVTLSASPNATDFVPIKDAAWTEATWAVQGIALTGGYIKATVSGAGASTSLTVDIL